MKITPSLSPVIAGILLLFVSTFELTTPSFSLATTKTTPEWLSSTYYSANKHNTLLNTGNHLSLTYRNYGIGFGDVPIIHGLRINYRDNRLQKIHGINITMREPGNDSNSIVRGLAIGLPLTGGGDLMGVSIGLGGVAVMNNITGFQAGGLGIGADGSIRGIQLAGLGIGAGGSIEGLSLSGLGIGSGGHIRGVTITLLGIGSGEYISGITLTGMGIGAGESITGITFAGFGFGTSGDIKGINVAGLGIGSGENISGLSFAGVGIGAGGIISGLSLAGIGIGAGDQIRGVSLSGIGTGTGDHIKGLHVAGVGIGAPNLTGVTISMFTGGFGLARGLFISPVHFKMKDEGSLSGVSTSVYNRIEGTQHGLTIGIYNFARNLNGIQIGLLNYAGNNPPGLRLLPLFNANL